MFARINFQGPVRYRVRAAAQLARAAAEVSARRLRKGARRPGWNWWVEVATQLLNRQLVTAFGMSDAKEARGFLNSMVIRSPALSDVTMTPVSRENFKGTWFTGKDGQPQVTVLYLHGGGYSFYPQSYANFIALITLAAKSKTFALDYRLSPEYRFPAQLDDALYAYHWLLDEGVDPANLVVAGDSAGGNLALALLLRARESNLPLPSLAVALSPATDFCIEPTTNDCDWIEPKMLAYWADCFCDPAQRIDPLVSPVLADLRGLPPIYVQAGRCEVLFDSIQAFAEVAKRQGADVTLDAWDDMNHDFQLFGPDAPQSAEALRRIGEVIAARLRPPQTPVSQPVGHGSTMSPDQQFDFDFIVIGSGFGGSVSALRLAEKGYRVAVMEMGRRWTPENLPRTSWSIHRWFWRPRLGLRGFFNMRYLPACNHPARLCRGRWVHHLRQHLASRSRTKCGTWARGRDWPTGRRKCREHFATASRMLGIIENRILGPADHLLKKSAEASGCGHTFYRTHVGIFQSVAGEPVRQTYPDPFFGGEGPERSTCNACGGCMMGCQHGAKNTLDLNYLYLAEKRGVQIFAETKVVDVKPLGRFHAMAAPDTKCIP